MRVTRLYTGDDGQSHFEDIDMPLFDQGDIGRLSELVPATGVIFRKTSGDYHYEWHNAPRRQYIVMLEGEVEIEVVPPTTSRRVVYQVTATPRSLRLAPSTFAAMALTGCVRMVRYR